MDSSSITISNEELNRVLAALSSTQDVSLSGGDSTLEKALNVIVQDLSSSEGVNSLHVYPKLNLLLCLDDVPEHDDEDDGGVAQITFPKTTEDVKSPMEQQDSHPGNLESPLLEAANKREKVLESLASGSGVSRSSHVFHECAENHPKCEPADVQGNTDLAHLKDPANPSSMEEGTYTGEGHKCHDIGLLARKAHLQLPDKQQENPPRQSLPISGSDEPGDIFGQSAMKSGVMSQDVSAIITSLEQKVLDLNKENISFRKKASYMSLLGLLDMRDVEQAKYQEKNEELDHLIHALQVDNERIYLENKNLLISLKAQKEEWEAERESLQHEVSSLKERLQVLQKKIEWLEAERKKLRQNANKPKVSVHSQTTGKGWEQTEGRVKELEAKLIAVNQELKEKCHSLEIAQKEINRWKSLHNETASLQKEIKRLEEKSKKDSVEKEKKDRQIKALEIQMKSLKSHNSASENFEIEHLSKKIEEQKAKCEEQAHSHEVAILHLRKEYEDLKVASEQHLIRLRGQLHEKEVEIAHLKAEVCRQKQDAGVMWENQEKREQIEELQRRNAALEKTVRRLQEEREHLLYQSSAATPGSADAASRMTREANGTHIFRHLSSGPVSRRVEHNFSDQSNTGESVEELKTQLSISREAIERLKSKVADQGKKERTLETQLRDAQQRSVRLENRLLEVEAACQPEGEVRALLHLKHQVDDLVQLSKQKGEKYEALFRKLEAASDAL
ncbi:unnamed protein product [Darwinula stevensoni]|uniref:Uncharacterized protein n=1 Tax=Darwinula stevensoni TaxID=69355 RepID=A0A7R9AAN5_9CRUS|nr:unnamed protein product [Darwinula stevensoni]CAG0898543.1 unnamed protein product [Darwinula stevensoni]